MFTVSIYPLVDKLPVVPTFAQQFERKIDADDYVAFWRRLGSCHIKRSRELSRAPQGGGSAEGDAP
jgi:hypothetical protein